MLASPMIATKHPGIFPVFGLLFIGLTALSAPQAQAQDNKAAPARDTQARDTQAQKRDWDITIGGGGVLQPDYEGSDEYKVSPLPYVNIKYKDLVFLRGPMLGANLLTMQGPRPGDKLQIGPLIRYQMGREADDNDALRGLGDIDAGFELGGFITYGVGPWSVGVTAFQDISDTHDGLTVKLNGGYNHAFGPKLRGRVEVYTTWASDDYMQTFFGVSAAQSPLSGMRQYTPEAGFKDVGLSINMDYAFNQHWGLTGMLGYKQLLGDAADSPLVEDRGSASQLMSGLFLRYRF